jgi:hypothetical protein
MFVVVNLLTDKQNGGLCRLSALWNLEDGKTWHMMLSRTEALLQLQSYDMKMLKIWFFSSLHSLVTWTKLQLYFAWHFTSYRQKNLLTI